MSNTDKILNRLLSLVASVLLFLFALRYLAPLFDDRNITLITFLYSFSSMLYFGAAILLMLDFMNIQILWVKKKVWLPLYLIGLSPKVIVFVLLCVLR